VLSPLSPKEGEKKKKDVENGDLIDQASGMQSMWTIGAILNTLKAVERKKCLSTFFLKISEQTLCETL